MASAAFDVMRTRAAREARDPWATITTPCIGSNFLLDQIFWQHANRLSDRFDCQGFLDTNVKEPALTINLGDKRVGCLIPWIAAAIFVTVCPAVAPSRQSIPAALVTAKTGAVNGDQCPLHAP